MSESQQLFEALQLDVSVIKNLLKNKNLTQNFTQFLQEAGITQATKKQGNLLYNVAVLTESFNNRRVLLARYIVEDKIDSSEKYNAAIAYLTENRHTAELNVAQFDKAAGVGVVTTEEDIQRVVSEFIDSKKDELQKIRYTYNVTNYLAKIRSNLPFANGGLLNKEFLKQIEAFLGPKTEEDQKMKEALQQANSKKESAQSKGVKANKTEDAPEEDDDKAKLKKMMNRDMQSALNSKQLLDEHKKATGGKIVTRFPPEPNGYLHIGHAKAMRFSFTTASDNNGYTILRFDDTNPEKECHEYIVNIEENVKWLGYTPKCVTHAADNFDKLYEFAVQLIKAGKAYVCGESKEMVNDKRAKGIDSAFRDTPVEQNLKMFNNMKLGMYKEGEYVLRLKVR